MSANHVQPTSPSFQGAIAVRRDQSAGAEGRSASAFLAEVHEHTRAGRIRTARRLAQEAADRFPEDLEIRKALRILSGGKATPRPRTGRSLREEYEWLRHPPAEYRGRWVALVGREVVATGDTLEEMQASLPADLELTPLAVQIVP